MIPNPNGTPIECVVADTCIGGVATAARTAEQFRRENAGAPISAPVGSIDPVYR